MQAHLRRDAFGGARRIPAARQRQATFSSSGVALLLQAVILDLAPTQQSQYCFRTVFKAILSWSLWVVTSKLEHSRDLFARWPATTPWIASPC